MKPLSRPLSRPLSLKARAIALLAQREHSRTELRRKLLRIARNQARAHASDVAGQPGAAELIEPVDESVDEERIDRLLDELQSQGYLSETRFVESRVHARAQRFGNLRIRQELAQHGLVLDADHAQSLHDSEFERARTLWQRKFGVTAEDAAGQARQMRFLSGRGFSPEVIRRVLRAARDPE